MSKKYILFIIIFLLAVSGIYYYQTRTREVQINGRITNVNNACFSDGTCTITIDNRDTIITSCPNGIGDDGLVCGLDNNNLKLGDKVETHVRKTKSGYDIQCSGCYITKSD